jgi:signal transduction histidine kinase
MLHHDLKTPLTSINGCAQLMQRRGQYSDWAMSAIVTEADRLTLLIDELLETLCLEDGRRELKPVELDLVALAHTMVEWAQALTEVHTIRIESPAGPLTGWWDRGALERVFKNLLSNAIRYSQDGEILVRVEDHGQEALVFVTDQGPGIPPEELPRVFDRFYRGENAVAQKIQGLGIGLYCCKLLVEAHGGRVWAESVPGQGSTFFFTLPYQPADC